MSKISQREARRLRKRVSELERAEESRRNVWVNEYPGGAHIGTINCASLTADVMVKVARQCGHAVVAVNGTNEIRLYALPLGRP